MIAPIILCMNEERFILQVLRNLLVVFPKVFVADTGSTDRTLELLTNSSEFAHSRIHLWTYKNLSLTQLGQIRYEVCQQAKTMFGAELCFQCDSDEYYFPEALRFIVDNPMPEGKRMGFTEMVSVDRDADGNYWELSDHFARAAMFPIDDKWTGDYPWETPESFFLGKDYFHYWPLLGGLFIHGYHLHPLTRSSRDADVPFRLEKQKLFSMCEQKHVRTHLIGKELPGVEHG